MHFTSLRGKEVFTRAAERLSISQPAVTRRISDMERDRQFFAAVARLDTSLRNLANR
ncbi:MAG: helix-turn-helix domain-containing protein [Candidatus Binatia bacterium]